jgi:hypothetical protein
MVQTCLYHFAKSWQGGGISDVLDSSVALCRRSGRGLRRAVALPSSPAARLSFRPIENGLGLHEWFHRAKIQFLKQLVLELFGLTDLPVTQVTVTQTVIGLLTVARPGTDL